MAQLAIKGHPTRGKEVIQLLEILGGTNKYQIGAYRETYVYFVDIDGIIRLLKINQLLPELHIIYNLEEFEEKFPYKVGDKVTNEYRLPMIIFDMYWDSDFNVIKYNVRFLDDDKTVQTGLTAKDLQPYKEENIETTESLNKWLDGEPEPEPKAPILSNRYDYAEGKCGYVIPDGYEFDYIKQGFQTEIILKPKKSQYPKTYEECCEVIDYKLLGTMIIGYKAVVLKTFQKLLICRDAYWKIAGEELGLGKPWEPDWNDCAQHKFGLYTLENEIRCINLQVLKNIILAFPTAEMRDAFYENFKDLIEQCKELL